MLPSRDAIIYILYLFFEQSRRGSSSSPSSSPCSVAVLDRAVDRLLPGLLHPRLTALSLRYEFVRHSPRARDIAIKAIW